MTTTEAQALWDLEDAAAYRDRVRDASKKVLEADEHVARARVAWREATQQLATAEAAVTEWTLATEPIPPAIFLQRLRVLEGEVQKAEEEVRRTKQELNGARASRGRLWDERRVTIRTKFERYPLEEFAQRQQVDRNSDAPQVNGHAEARVETAKTPVADLDDDHREIPLRERLNHIALADVLKPGDAADFLARRGYQSIGDLCDLVGDEPRPLDEVLSERFGIRTADAVNVLFDIVEWLRENPPQASGIVQRCRECGCIEDECAGCILRTGKPCLWANKEKDLCTACVAEREEEEAILPEGEPWQRTILQPKEQA